MRFLLPLVFLPLLSACLMSESHRHTPLSSAALATLEPGVSSAGDVVEALGAPNEVVQIGKRSAYRYDHSVEKQAGLFLILVALRRVDTQQDRAWLFFDEAGVLTHVGATFDSNLAEYSLPWSGR